MARLVYFVFLLIGASADPLPASCHATTGGTDCTDDAIVLLQTKMRGHDITKEEPVPKHTHDRIDFGRGNTMHLDVYPFGAGNESIEPVHMRAEFESDTGGNWYQEGDFGPVQYFTVTRNEAGSEFAEVELSDADHAFRGNFTKAGNQSYFWGDLIDVKKKKKLADMFGQMALIEDDSGRPFVDPPHQFDVGDVFTGELDIWSDPKPYPIRFTATDHKWGTLATLGDDNKVIDSTKVLTLFSDDGTHILASYPNHYKIRSHFAKDNVTGIIKANVHSMRGNTHWYDYAPQIGEVRFNTVIRSKPKY